MVMDLNRATFMGSFRSSTVRTGKVAIVGPTIFSIPGTDNRISVDAVNPPTPVEVPSGTFLLATAISLECFGTFRIDSR
ncbi:hypothetical protein A7D00_7301 [Trichophyton violaceum]|uniref:Uncharacterized protein n=1 Tax=Trichophyton violaceum TaxID=34388 RepID=A0A178F8T8_TRIVO|nr:hypothetical protein A7D00_7301 [Trichophyton violaceum]